VTDSALHFTMRELQRMFFSPRLWAGLMGAALVLGLVGPFGTFEGLSLLPRLAYWTAIVVFTFFAAIATNFFLVGLMFGGKLPGPLPFALTGAAAGLPVTLIVLAINSQVFGPGPAGIRPLALLAYCVAITAIVSALMAVFYRGVEAQPESATTQTKASEPERPKILARLPLHLRGRLLRLAMQDHYVEVHTDKGKTLVLMRMADAIGETSGAPGLQIHRSHWVALAAVKGTSRKDGRLFLEAADGAQLPVSRSFLAEVRKAGLA
jgi:hypothetical protein